MPAPSLRHLCTATAIRNVKYLNDIGNIPYELARPFLLKIESPEKLRSLELQSPHLMKDDVELWLEFIKRDIPRSDEIELPEQPDCWYDVYCDLREQVQRAVDEDAEKLKMALDGISSERAKHSAILVDRRSLHLPRERPTAKQRYASFDRKMGGIAPVFSSKNRSGSSSDPQGTPIWSFGRPSAPRETKKKNIFTATKRNPALAVPTKQLNNRATQVRQAPRSLIEEHRRPPESAIPQRPTLRVPGRSGSQAAGRSHSSPVVVNSSLQEREARLRALTSGRTTASASPSRTHPRPLPQVSSSARSGLSSSSSSARPSPGSLATTARSQPRTAQAAAEDSRSSESALNTGLEASRASPPRAMVRKRPAPNVFIQPKKKKVT
ncbi:RNA polymerase II transcription factor SIII subunit A-domain-containing protein [Aspergillus pseudodeflectus]|uniref:RNA polymerase II transcription factor SIII subunit A-domain-containing protein n=1 Tax=Aspergillus pseudodeflectus TaxID=176178 RepID=A0ABR4JEP6_9EURO